MEGVEALELAIMLLDEASGDDCMWCIGMRNEGGWKYVLSNDLKFSELSRNSLIMLQNCTDGFNFPSLIKLGSVCMIN